MRGRIKAIFFDIDGTLVSFKSHTVPESARRAIARLREQGVKVFIATGRLMKHVAIVNDIEVDGYITVNGGYCITSAGEVIFESAFPRATVERVIDLSEQYGFDLNVMTHQDMYVSSMGERVKKIASMINIMPTVADVRAIAATQPVVQMCPYISRELEQEIMPLLPDCVGSRWIETFMDLNVRGVDKSLGIQQVMNYYGLTMAEAMAFGDGGNDLPMVRDAAVGVAMGNACDELKAVADYITSSVDEDGVSRALEHFGLI
ncbi:MAG: Cof-type HAD-IIB family hydrolase [Alistipes sp.]|nr:Cof-type HAD-IIB family hydrolase [Alistipes sp.]